MTRSSDKAALLATARRHQRERILEDARRAAQALRVSTRDALVVPGGGDATSQARRAELYLDRARRLLERGHR